MATLTDTQLVTLSRALQRSDGAVIVPPTLKGAAAHKFAKRLIALGLVRVMSASPAMPVWRRTEDGEPQALVITDGAYAALGVMTPPSPPADDLDDERARGAIAFDHQRPSGNQGRGPTRGKGAAVLALLRAQDGASLEALEQATSWQKHTIRAFLSGLRKSGLAVIRVRHADVTVYRVQDGVAPLATAETDGPPVAAGAV